VNTLTRKTAGGLRCICAMATAFKSNGLNGDDAPIDWPSQKKHIDRLNSGGVHAIAAAVTTSEAATMSHDEQIGLIRDVAAYQAQYCPQIPIIAGTGSNCTAEALTLTKRAIAVGADAALIGMPYYNKPTPRGQLAHYTCLADTGAPIILYSVSSRTGRLLDLHVVAELAANHENILGIKDAESPARFEQLRGMVPPDFVIWSGNDDQTFEAMKAGWCDGVVSVTANIVPDKIKRMVDVGAIGLSFDWENAEAINRSLVRLTQLAFCETNPIPVKHMLALMGVFKQAAFRLPLVPMSDADKLEQIRQELLQLDLIPSGK